MSQVTFEPFTSTKTSLLFAQKKTKDEIEHWNEVWYKYANEWNNLKTRCENIIKVHTGEKNRSKLSSIKNFLDSEDREILFRMLKSYIEEHDNALLTQDVIAKYQNELIELCKYDKDNLESFGFVNIWRVFGEVAKELIWKLYSALCNQYQVKKLNQLKCGWLKSVMKG